jgi:hypothetical protein
MVLKNREFLRIRYEERICHCGRYFYVAKQGRAKHSSRECGVRQRNAKTCSPKCSRNYTRKRIKEASDKLRLKKQLEKNENTK